MDYTTLQRPGPTLGALFWRDLELHHPGIGSLRLPPDVAAAWKQRILTRTARPAGGGEQAVAAGIGRDT